MVQTASLSTQWGHYGPKNTYDGDLETHCRTLNETLNRLTLNFAESFVTKVEIFNVQVDGYVGYITGAIVKILTPRRDVTKVCGTISDVSAHSKFVFECNIVGSRVDIELPNQFLIVAEVKIYGRGKFI